MSFFKNLFKKGKRPGTHAYRMERARELHGLAVKYVTERNGDNDDVIGRGGSLSVHEDKFIVDSSGKRLFMCEIRCLDSSFLMSGDGVIISGPDLLNNGLYRCITVHFVYHRK